MKSPWKMIGQLVFRRRSPEEAQELADGQETSSSSSAPVQPFLELKRENVTHADETILADAKADDGISLANLDAIDRVATRSSKRSNQGLAQKSKREPEAAIASTPPVTRPRRGKKPAPTEPVNQEVEAAADRQTSTRPSGANIHAEVAGVDVEIRALTRQLAEKLKQQNAQLHKMLERFGGPDA
ncbi:hypothetical protein [Sinorhizobium sp. RAC02]|uniref:hypothetical protein n=1 Tax=Sinorhizobium sp. RAC02 TaxID=1842534 RepID=UPI00083D3574|nr:hypothetical protein [Sinorhizobium sp. RAC02]AOF93525.1 hypothetical protein BSY16_4130 [Sinorhizobium sp. RAC02]AOF94374.1 hypothetical protein BSY16_4083 [Sinorhizobium sp. RAC02]